MSNNPAIVDFKNRVNAAFPGRNKGVNIEGIGGCDAKHAAAGSAHCRGDAVDIVHDPASGASGDAIAAMAIKDPKIKNVIFNSRIWNRSTGTWSPFTGRYTSGARKGQRRDPHEHHVHVEAYRAGRGDPAPTAGKKTKRRKGKRRRKPVVTPRRRKKKKPVRHADASQASPSGGRQIVQGDHGVLLGETQLMAAHVTTPHTGGGFIKKGSPGVFIGERQLAFARIGDPTSDGYRVKTGDAGILVG